MALAWSRWVVCAKRTGHPFGTEEPEPSGPAPDFRGGPMRRLRSRLASPRQRSRATRASSPTGSSPPAPPRLGGLVHAPVRPEDQEAVEGASEPPVVCHGDDGPLERGEALLERLG